MNKMLRSALGALTGAALLAVSSASAATVNVLNANITASVTNQWYATNTYVLQEMVFVPTNTVLQIEAGTVIQGATNGGQGLLTPSLVIARGGKLYAQGTPTQPIIFTAEGDDVNNPSDLGIHDRGLWGGIVILGNATLNSSKNTTGLGSTPIYDVFEGLPDQETLRFGGSDDNDNSGVLRYVSVRHGGKVIATAKEINGVSFGGVGRGTVVEFVEVYANEDDGFEFFGGTVNTKYLIAAFCNDDSFDTDQGYRGTNQFWFSIQSGDGTRNFGGEYAGDPVAPKNRLPLSDFHVWNATYIGAGVGAFNATANTVFDLKEDTAAKHFNSVFTDFANKAVNVKADADVRFAAGDIQLKNNVWWAFGNGTGTPTTVAADIASGVNAATLFTDASHTNLLVNPLLRGISRTNIPAAALDPRPLAGSPALVAANIRVPAGGGFLQPVNFIGAFGPNDLWANGWTALAKYGFLPPPGPTIVNVYNTNIVAGANLTWTANNTYILQDMVFIPTNTTLRIEAGTVVKGANTGGQGLLTPALVIARGGKLFAEGTPDRPIIFTAENDDVNNPSDLGIHDRGLWGGIVILGNATLNSSKNTTGLGSTPIYDVFEGLPDQETLRFGGNDDNDNSGVLRYVSVRHGGKVIATAKEINGVSFGGVGRGTVVEFVEVYANEDDGFEFFGGTVNTRYLVAAFCNDDSFDTDQGYRGENQFWFSIQSGEGTRNFGGEYAGDPVSPKNRLPLSDFRVWNATYIGAGVGAFNATANTVFDLKEDTAAKHFNSVFTDFANKAVNVKADADVRFAAGDIQLKNNLWWAFGNGTATPTAVPTDIATGVNAATLFTDPSHTNLLANPQLRGITRTNLPAAGLDPRPLAGSPALDAANIRVPAGGGFIQPVNFIGAFGPDDLWIAKWTALAKYGFIPAAGGNVISVANAGIAAGTTIQWYRTNTYVLQDMVFIPTNTTLRIEAGTVIKGATNGGQGLLTPALVIARGGKLFAEGTPTQPIIFTAESDDVNNPSDLGIHDRGLWGGIVILGNATLNSSKNTTGLGSTPIYDVFEGLPDQETLRFGGSDDNDNSGVLRYVSVRHGGKVIATAKEINGVSFGGVGRGTVVEFVEVYANEDDGFEFFGGTVNTKYLIAAFCNDDSFDTDQGYRGQNQFWFSIQSGEGTRNFGGEYAGDPVAPKNRLPLSDFRVWNATYIGAGVGAFNATANTVFDLKEDTAAKHFNSVFTDFANKAVNVKADADVRFAAGDIQLKNNVWWAFGNGTATPTTVAADIATGVNAATLFTDASHTNLLVDPQLGGIARTNVPAHGLDPRPSPVSPAFTVANVRATPVDGFYSPASYIGAFGNQNWAADWTALGAYGFMSGAGSRIANPAPAELPVGAPVINAQPLANNIGNGGGTINLTASVAGATSFQWYKNGVAIPGANSATLTLNNVRGSAGLDHTGPSSSRPPFQEAVDSGYALISLMSVGDTVNNKADGVTPHRLVGLMDGLGAFDNGDGTFTVLVNHEVRNTDGIVRAHGAIGAFVSKLVIAKSNLAVLNVSDLATNIQIWNGSGFVQSNAAIARLCSADLPAVSAFNFPGGGVGTPNRIFMNGEENTDGRAFAFVATGPDAGKAWQLPYLGKFAWENSLASPFAQAKTIVMGMDDDGTTDSQVYVYIGNKQAGGLDIEKAGLQNGSLYGVQVTGLAQEVAGTTAVQRNFTLFNFGNVTALSEQNLEDFGNTNAVTAFQRVEDGVWDPANPRDFYFVTTASFTGTSRLWRLRFTDIANPESGGVIDMLLDGTEGIKMMDNIGIDPDGNLLIQEDVGNQAHNGKTWKYVVATDSLVLVSQHRPNLVTTGQLGFLTQDEEASGIVDVSATLGYRAYLIADQFHTTTGIPAGLNTTELRENGQLQLMVEVANGTYTLVAANGNGSVTSAVANVTITAPPIIGDTLFRNGLPGATVSSGGTLVLSVPTNAVAGTGPFTYQWFLNGTLIPGATSSTLMVNGFLPVNGGNYSVQISNGAGVTTSVPVPVSTADIAFFGGVTIEGPANAKYRIEFLADITNTNSWTSLTNIVHPGGKQFYIDTTSPGTQRRFFRAVPTP